MFSAIVLSLLSVAPPPVAAQDDPAIRISLNNDRRFEAGDRAHVKVRVENDGFLVVVHADPDGRVRMLFPLDPDDDNFVRGNRTYEIRGRGDRESFSVDYESGEGAVYAAVSRDPFRFDQFTVNRHWDYDALNATRLPEDPEPELTELVQRMASGRFDYDYLTYDVYRRGSRDVVYGPTVVRSYYDDCGGYYLSYRCDPYYYSPSRFSVSIAFGRPYYYGYRPYYYGYRPAYYDPFYDPWYDDYYYARPYNYGYYRPVYVYPVRPYSPYRPRYVNQAGFKQDTRTWGGESYRVRSTAASDIRAVNTVYGEPPSRRLVTEGDVGASPVLQPSPSREVNASPSRRPVERKATTVPEARRSRQDVDLKRSSEKAPEGRSAVETPAPRRSSADDGERQRPEPVRATPSRAREDSPSREEPRRVESPRSRDDDRAEPSRPAPSRAEPTRAEPSRAEPERSAPRPSVDRAPAPSRPSYSAPRQAPSPSRAAPASGGGRRRVN
ncbi:MAG TPA: DUF4384 domain-containing protein [Gemmatimonadales bacterium]